MSAIRSASSPKGEKKHTAVIVLGMHRSGTSALGGVLSQLGCDLPAHLMPAHETNPKGFFESMAIYKLNDAILASAGSNWYDWLPFNRTWFQSPPAGEFADRAIEVLLEEFGGSPLFVMKDPRICRLFPFWANVLEVADIRPAIVHIHRNPLDVAASLRVRDGKAAELTQLVWLCHMLNAERDSRGMARSFVSYDQLLQNWAGLVERVGQDLDIGWPRSPARAAIEIDAFLTSSLHHHMQAKEQILENPLASIWVRETYRILQNWVQDGERKEDYSTLDSIAREFEHSASAFARLIDAGLAAQENARKAGSEVKQLQVVLSQEKARLAEAENVREEVSSRAESEKEALRQTIADTQRALEQERADHREAQTNIVRLVAEQTDLLKAIAEAENREVEARATLEQMKQALVCADDENDALREDVDQFCQVLVRSERGVAKLSVVAREVLEIIERNQASLVQAFAHDTLSLANVDYSGEMSAISKLIVEIDNIIS